VHLALQIRSLTAAVFGSSVGAPALQGYAVDTAVPGHARKLSRWSRQPSPGTACGVVAKR